jgi:hypothetical protein
MVKKTKKKKEPARRLSQELDQQFGRFLERVSPKHFSRALRDAVIEITSDIEQQGTPSWLYELTDGLHTLFRALDIAEDEGKYSNRDIDER